MTDIVILFLFKLDQLIGTWLLFMQMALMSVQDTLGQAKTCQFTTSSSK